VCSTLTGGLIGSSIAAAVLNLLSPAPRAPLPPEYQKKKKGANLLKINKTINESPKAKPRPKNTNQKV